MIRITNLEISAQDFHMAVRKLTGAPLPIKTAYNVKRIVDKLMSAQKSLAKRYQKQIVPEYCEMDGDKPKLTNPQDPASYIVKNVEGLKGAQTKFDAEVIEIDRNKLSLEDLGAIQFSAHELMVLEPLVEFPVEEGDQGAK